VSELTGEFIDGRYQLLEVIAAGGMATIYRAMDTRLDRLVAVKVMHPHLAKDEEFVNRFIREAKATAALSHPNIVSILDQGWNEGGTPAVFIVMEYIDGFTLRDLLSETGPLSIPDFLRYMVPVASGLAVAHRLGINHRDLKPENILISKDGRIKIADFGLARGGVLGSTMTVESSIVLGSVSYLSPEQVQRGVSDARSDIYSLGIVFFELLTGEKPFEGESPIQIAYKHVNERISAPSSRRSGIPEKLDAIIVKATSPNPDHRHNNSQELLEDLRKLQVELDPQRNQMSLELDLPISPVVTQSPRKKRGREEVRIGNTTINRFSENFTGATTGLSTTESIRPDFTQSRQRESKDDLMGTTAELRRKKVKHVRRNRIVLLLILLLLGAAGAYTLLGLESGVSVPSVVGMKKKEAISTLEALGLHVTVGSPSFDPTVPAGKVISSNPGGGGHVSKNGTVTLNLSQGPTPEFTPSASATPSASNFPSAPPTASPTKINIDSYINKSGDQAQSELTSAGLNVSQSFGFSDTVSAGNVMSQNPDGSSPIASGSTVSIVISQGPELVPIPNILSMTRTSAITALENIQLTVIVHKVGAGKHVIRVSPKVGTEVKRGSTVTITLG
jgi:serine/threonine-protein kinase